MSVRDRFAQELSLLLCETLRLGPPHPEIAADEALFGGRLGLDSVDALQWATAVEQRYRCELSPDELTSGALESLGQMADALLTRGILPSPT